LRDIPGIIKIYGYHHKCRDGKGRVEQVLRITLPLFTAHNPAQETALLMFTQGKPPP
jgi:hypothetical protein